MLEPINDPIDVVVSFSQNRVLPRRMRWSGREYAIKTVHLAHASHEGTKKIFYFSVSDLANYFKLRLDTDTLEWRLVEMYAAG